MIQELTSIEPDHASLTDDYRWFLSGRQPVDEKPKGRMMIYRSSTNSGILKVLPPQDNLTIDSKVQDWLKFKKLVAEWKKERGARSSIIVASCHSYLSIIGMGEDKAVPFILAQLQSEGQDPDQWFLALKVLTGVDPVNADDRGNYRKMSQAWLKWAETSPYAGYLAST